MKQRNEITDNEKIDPLGGDHHLYQQFDAALGMQQWRQYCHHFHQVGIITDGRSG